MATAYAHRAFSTKLIRDWRFPFEFVELLVFILSPIGENLLRTGPPVIATTTKRTDGQPEINRLDSVRLMRASQQNKEPNEIIIR